MPPRFAYWTIILDGTPTSFRTREQAELLPTFNQLKKKNPGAIMKWFSGGTLWDSPEQAGEKRRLERERLYQEARAREERARDERPRDQQRPDERRSGAQAPSRRPGTDHPRDERGPERRPDARRSLTQPRDFRPGNSRPSHDRPRDERSKPDRPRDGQLDRRNPRDRPAPADVDQKPRTEPRPRTAAPGTGAPRRSRDWRPGGEHRDPRDKYKLPPGEARKRWKRRNLGPAKPKP